MHAPFLDVQYLPRAFADADATLSFLNAEVVWDTRMRARQTASFGLPYNYSGQEYAACPMPPLIAALAARAAELAGHPFNNCLCNRYPDGRSSMGFHQDSYEGLEPESKIAVLSFGATRELQFRSLDHQHRAARRLEHGSLLLMSRGVQQLWKHAVIAQPDAGLRISVTLRSMEGIPA